MSDYVEMSELVKRMFSDTEQRAQILADLPNSELEALVDQLNGLREDARRALDGRTPPAPEFAAYIRQCGSCDAPIIWARTENGRSMPINAEPDGDGNVLIENRQGFLRVTVYGPLSRPNLTEAVRAQLRTPHFRTCPDASAWRKR